MRSRSKATAIIVLITAITSVLGAYLGLWIGGGIAPDKAEFEWVPWMIGGLFVGVWLGAMAGIAIGFWVTGRSLLISAAFWSVAVAGPVVGGCVWLALAWAEAERVTATAPGWGMAVVGGGASAWLGHWIAHTRAKGEFAH